jgi:CRISPR-associated protein Cmx8
MADDRTDDKELARQVLTVARTYVTGRTQYRTGMDPDTFPMITNAQGRQVRQYPKEWYEASAKVAQEAFLQMRACKTQQDFVEFLVGTLCTHGLRNGERAYNELHPEMIGLAAADKERWADVRSLAMLAISTMSYVRES